MTSFTLDELQRIADIYRQYIGVRHLHVMVTHQHMGRAMGRAYIQRHQIILQPQMLKESRRRQLALIIHEICHFKTPKSHHNKVWKANAYLWASEFQMRFCRPDNSVAWHLNRPVKQTIESGYRCPNCLNLYSTTDGLWHHRWNTHHIKEQVNEDFRCQIVNPN